ncbi:putative NAD/FAD-binding protein [Pelomonas aquatica]|uniref:NAD/FAD-binding protein n=1 Tax=Pelomonas aquatica TaxID=431058 RepID=A0ABU1Z904_9BURK|nr:putative NAD/FAD-binding protein [Pelomonas aquatica]
MASGRSAAAFTARARVDDAGPSFCPADGHATPALLGLLRGRGRPRRPGGNTARRVAVVGSGIAGLSAAWALSDRAHVTLFEAGPQAGGHTHTVDVTLDGPHGPVTHGVDTGFLVFNERTYPLLIQLFDQLGIATAKSDMSFSAQVPGDGIEWSGSSLATVFAQRRNLLRPAFWGMLADLLRFNRLCTALAERGDEAALAEPIGAFLARHRFGNAFRDWYLLPMVACIWSCPTAQMLQFPIRTLIRFCHNHGLLQVNDRPQWWTVSGGARHYVDAMLPAIHDVRLGTPVQAIHRPPAGGDVVVQSARGREHFDAVILAGHSDQSLAMLAVPTEAEHQLLGAIRYQANLAVLHTDTALLPRRRAAWAAWNYESGADAGAVCLHYLLNQLQPLPWHQPVIVSLNPLRQPAPERVLGRYTYAHPVFDDAAVRAQARLADIQGAGGVWFAGAWTRYGFHEDGLLSGLCAAQQVISKVLA